MPAAPTRRAAPVVLIVVALAACRTATSEVTDPGAAPAWNCSARLELSSAWEHLASRYDADGDGRVTLAEYPRGEVRFANFDRDGDGALEASDFPSDTYFNGFSHMLLGDADTDGDEAITREEWRSYCAAMDGDGDGRVTPDEAEEMLGGWTRDWRLFLLSFDQDGDADFDEADLELTFRDQDYDGDGVLRGKETEGWESAVSRPEGDPPAVGEAAPRFTLPFADDPARTFDLADDRRGRPVALVFGSYT